MASGELLAQDELRDIEVAPHRPERLKGQRFAEGLAYGHVVLHEAPVPPENLLAENPQVEEIRLREALMILGDFRGQVITHTEKAWASITFSGARHTLVLLFAGEEAVELSAGKGRTQCRAFPRERLEETRLVQQRHLHARRVEVVAGPLQAQCPRHLECEARGGLSLEHHPVVGQLAAVVVDKAMAQQQLAQQ